MNNRQLRAGHRKSVKGALSARVGNRRPEEIRVPAAHIGVLIVRTQTGGQTSKRCRTRILHIQVDRKLTDTPGCRPLNNEFHLLSCSRWKAPNHSMRRHPSVGFKFVVMKDGKSNARTLSAAGESPSGNFKQRPLLASKHAIKYDGAQHNSSADYCEHTRDFMNAKNW